jgi:hypothetical protein
MIPECRLKDLTGNRDIPKTLTTKLNYLACVAVK